MRPEEDRSFSSTPRTIDIDRLAEEADRYQVPPEDLAQAVRTVGANRTAVELFLNAPPA